MKRARPLLGTFVEIELRAKAAPSSLNRWISAGFAAIEEVDRCMSPHRSDSDVSRLNQAAPGEWVDVNPLTVTVLQAAEALHRHSLGLFDIRCGGVPQGSSPLLLEGTRAQKNGPWSIDLGGIAKGYAVDCAVEAIQCLTAGYRVAGSVNAGGDMRLWGVGAVPAASQIQGHGTFWLRPFVVKETAAATSSTRAYSNERLSPAIHRHMPSGNPASHAETVTVFASRCLWADALTKIVLMASEKMANACLASYQAKALIFNPNGTLKAVMG